MPYVRYLIGRIVKTYDYINLVVLTLPLSVYEVRGQYSPLPLLCITMILRVRRKFLKLLHSPTPETFPVAETGLPIYNSSPPDHSGTPHDVRDLIRDSEQPSVTTYYSHYNSSVTEP